MYPNLDIECETFFSEAYACCNQGLIFDEENDLEIEKAKAMYERSLLLISEAVVFPNATNSELYESMMAAKETMILRLRHMEEQEKERRRSVESTVRSEGTLQEDKVKEEIRSHLQTAGSEDADLIYFIPGGVQLVVLEDDQASAPTGPTSLQIFRLKGEKEEDPTQVKMFIQVGLWAYPLSSQTPVLKKELGTYVVPNPVPDHPNMFVSIILPRDMDKSIEEGFVHTLRQFTEVRSAAPVNPEELKRVSDKIATFLVRSGQRVSSGIHSTVEKTNARISLQGAKIRAKIDTRKEPVNINPMIRNGVHFVHKGSKVSARVTKNLLDKIGEVGIYVGKSVANRLSGDPRSRGIVGDACTVIGAGLVGVSLVWMAMEEAGKALFKHIANETVDIVQLRYGDEASTTAHKALFAIGHGCLTAYHVWRLGPRSVTHRMIRSGAVAMVLGVGGFRPATPSICAAEKKKEE
uniref:Senescence domain-containing protein n=1 Tax=Steinernema glaseri TaxID=37863 RepID=A0A1I7YED9_9BILA